MQRAERALRRSKLRAYAPSWARAIHGVAGGAGSLKLDEHNDASREAELDSEFGRDLANANWLTIAQVRLREAWGIEDAGRIPLEQLPKALQPQWASRAKNNYVQVGLQDAFRLLKSLGEELGIQFEQQNLTGLKSPLNERNNSILAHRFKPVTKNGYDQIAGAVGALRNSQEVTSAGRLLPEVR